MTRNTPIGILDSGSGGLSVLLSIQNLLPHESVIYVGDHHYIPYGNRTSDFVNTRVHKIMAFFIEKKVKLIVVACNTATVSGIDYYRSLFPDIPIVGVVPVIKTAAAMTKTKKFIVLSTAFTANSRYQKQLIRKFAPVCDVVNVGSSRLVSLIEEYGTEAPEVKKELQTLLKNFDPTKHDVIVLGCTHYPFLTSQIRAIVGVGAHIVDSGDAVARQVQRILEHRKEASGPNHTAAEHFFTTGDAKKVSVITSHLLGHDVNVSHVDI